MDNALLAIVDIDLETENVKLQVHYADHSQRMDSAIAVTMDMSYIKETVNLLIN